MLKAVEWEMGERVNDGNDKLRKTSYLLVTSSVMYGVD